jgi:hypothetical protein
LDHSKRTWRHSYNESRKLRLRKLQLNKNQVSKAATTEYMRGRAF